MLAWLARALFGIRHWWQGTQAALDDFVELEADFIRKTVYPAFEWVRKDAASPVHLPPVPLRDCRVALLTTAGAYRRGDRPFAMAAQGDASFRVLPDDVDFGQVRLRHFGYDTRRSRRDLNTVFPLQFLHELVEEGRVGSASPRHFSFMGYALKIEELEREALQVAGMLRQDEVDLVLLAPA